MVIISVRWDSAIMKARSCLSGMFFIDQVGMIFWYIHDNTNVLTQAKKLIFLGTCSSEKNGSVNKDPKYCRKTAISTDE